MMNAMNNLAMVMVVVNCITIGSTMLLAYASFDN